ncbi:unnamed protein product [Larinioides sclopetarius]|uniref:Uncharacterized protein n=1 Tax=Larinioides sclopetarius TaxID=280406 RepID=A0AAV1YVT7_9ARAC
MHFTVLFTLFGIIFASYDYPSEMESGDFESALCDNEEGEMSRVVSDCYDKINIQKADTCAAKKIAEQEGSEDAFTDIMNALTKCIGESFSQ